MLPVFALLLACTPDPLESPPPADSEPADSVPAALDPPCVRIEPEDPDGLDELRAIVEEDSGQEVSLRWWLNGEVYEGLGETVPADLTRHGERWTVEATAAGESAWDTVVIANVAPDLPVVEVTPAEPLAVLDDLLCSAAVSDPDDDPAQIAMRWTVDGQPPALALETTTIEGDTVPAAALTQGAVWVCTVEVDDGWGGQAAASSTPVTVGAFDPTRLDPWIEPEVWFDPLDALAGDEVVLHYEGSLAEREAVTARLGFDGWSEVAWEEAPTPFSTPEGAPAYAWERAMEPQDDGTWVLPLTLPAEIRAVHMVFKAEADTDDQDGLEYHWDPGFPYVGPYFTWNDAAGPTDGVVVTFESAAPCLGVVVYGGPDGLVHTRTGEVLDTLHHIVLDGLEPDTAYSGYVGDSTGRTSTPFSFHTVGEDEDQLSLIVMADMQDGAQPEDAWPAIALAALETVPEARAAVLIGDLAANDNPGHWWRFFAGGAPLFAQVPLIPMIGNHDTAGFDSSADNSSFLRWFDLPGAETYNTVDIGPARIITLSSELVVDLEPGSAQYTWLKTTLEATRAEARPWVFTGFHHPPYDIGGRFASQTGLYRGVTELFDGVVDWSIAGHEHIYQRTMPLRYSAHLAPSEAYGLGSEDGVGYLVTPTAGDNTFNRVIPIDEMSTAVWDLMAFPTPPGGEDYPEEQGFLQIDLDGPTFTLSSWSTGTPEAPLAPWVRDWVDYTKP